MARHPAELGPWWMAAHPFTRLSRLVCEGSCSPWHRSAVWCLAWPFSTAPRSARIRRLRVCRINRPTGASDPRGSTEALGRSRGGFGTKARVIADGSGRAVAFALTPVQAHELPQAVPLLTRVPEVPLWIVEDRGYSSRAFREHVWALGRGPLCGPSATGRLSRVPTGPMPAAPSRRTYGPG